MRTGRLRGWVPGLAVLVTLALSACQDAAPARDGVVTPPDVAWSVAGEGIRNRFGYAVATAGDVNGDGYDDVIVGADQYKQFTGRAYVYAGGPGGLDADPLFVASGEDVNNHFGYAVAAAGDVNADGYGDVIVGAYHYGNFRGRAYVYAGGASGPGDTPLTVVTGEAPDTYFGRAVGTAGDVDDDGYADVIVGAQAYDRSAGRAYVYAGGADGLTKAPIWVATGETSSSAFGESVGTAGDVNGDGYADLIVGAHGYAQGTGRATIYAGGPLGPDASPLFVATGAGKGDRFGFAVATAGDVNGDGYADVVVGAYGAADDAGRAYVYAGGPGGLVAEPLFIAKGSVAGGWFGRSVGTAGDLNADGYADLVVGAPSVEGRRGQVILYAGGADGLDPTPVVIRTGDASPTWFGKAAGSGGDVNGDGYADLIVGAYGYASWTGRVTLYLGGTGEH